MSEKTELQKFINRWVVTGDYGRTPWYTKFQADIQKSSSWLWIDKALQMMQDDTAVRNKLVAEQSLDLWNTVLVVVAAGLRAELISYGTT